MPNYTVDQLKVGDIFVHCTDFSSDSIVLVIGFANWRVIDVDFSQKEQMHASLHFFDVKSMNGDYSNKALAALTLLTLQEYEEKYGQQIQKWQ